MKNDFEITAHTPFNQPETVGASQLAPGVLRCHLAILRDEDGGYSVIVLNLPGVGSCGATEDEAVSNTKEAIVGVVESYREDGLDIPWATIDAYRDKIPEGANLKWILVHG